MKCTIIPIAAMVVLLVRVEAAPGIFQASESAGTQTGLSLGGINLLSVGGGYSKGASVGTYTDENGVVHEGGVAAGASTGLNIGIGPLQLTNENAAAAGAEYLV